MALQRPIKNNSLPPTIWQKNLAVVDVSALKSSMQVHLDTHFSSFEGKQLFSSIFV